MAHSRLIVLALVLAACGEHDHRAPPKTASATKRALDFPTDEKSWGKFHSKRYALTVPLPDGHAWKIDDHQHAELIADHPPTSSHLVITTIDEQDLMNRQRCEERARKRGWVPDGPLTTVDDQVTIGPASYDSRVWTALAVARQTGPGSGGVTGHVFLFGAFIRRCLLVHLTTFVPSATEDEQVLASRLAIANARIFKAIVMDPPRTEDDADLPREKPDIRH